MTVIERWIDESDVYLLILGGRYGSLDPKTGRSYTHLEYEYAVSQNKPLFAVVIKPEALEVKVKDKGTPVIEQENPHQLKAFREAVLKNLVKFWTDAKDIKLAIYETLSEFSYRKELTGWIKGDNSINSNLLAEEIARLTKENAELRSQLVNVHQSNAPLYNGLQFEELETLLKKELVDLYPSGSSTLLDVLLILGGKLAVGLRPNSFGESSACLRLASYKLAQDPNHRTLFTFTNDGHNFYLKALVHSL